MKMTKTISNKITISISALIISLIIFLLIFFINLAKENHINIIKREMREKIRLIEYHLNDNPGLLLNREKFQKEINDISKIIELRITVIDLGGIVTADSEISHIKNMDNHLYRTEIKNAKESGIGEGIRYSDTLDIEMLYMAKKYNNNNIIIRLAKPLHEVDEALKKLTGIILTAGIIILLLAVIITVLISRRITNPINEAIRFAEDFSSGNYTKRIRSRRDDETGTLQRSLNRLAEIIVDKMDSLILEQKKLEVTIESIHDGIAVIDHEKKILIANKAFNSFLEINIQPHNKKYYEVIRSRSLNAKIDYCLSAGKSSSFEEPLPNGRTFEIYINPITDRNTIQGILAVLHDISEQRRIEKLKTDLVGNISHELKTPVAILKGYLETINENKGDEKQTAEFIRKAISGADRLNSIINDMLTLNMLETTSDFPKENISIKKLIEGCVEILNPKISAKEITIKTALDKTDSYVSANRFLAEAIFFNLIENAINYNRQNGRITISADISTDKTSVSILDTGIGIPAESIDKIFERFYRVDKSRSRATGGTGLGLSIVKHAANLLLWNIKVESNSTGTTFTIEI